MWGYVGVGFVGVGSVGVGVCGNGNDCWGWGLVKYLHWN